MYYLLKLEMTNVMIWKYIISNENAMAMKNEKCIYILNAEMTK